MKRLVAAAVLAGVSLASIVGTLQADVTAEQVRAAIDHGVKYLKSQQHANGGWSELDMLGQHGGVSALCTLALLNSGVEPSDPAMQRALDYLRKVDTKRTYVVSLQTMVFARAEPEKDRMLIRRNVQWLESTQLHEPAWSKGGWTYPDPRIGGGSCDNSNSQFALLALYEAERVGVAAGDQTWRLAKTYWEQCQVPQDGSWQYSRSMPGSTGSMTCAGITSLVIASDRVQQRGDARVVGDHIECCQPRNTGDTDRVEKAMQWLGSHYSVAHNPGVDGGDNLYYYLYGLERAGRLTAHRFLTWTDKTGKTHRADWYREGAEFLIRKQDSLSGFWTGTGQAERIPTISTSLALLFLSKGRWPVVVGKLQHAPADDWNCHRNDVANLTRYVERKWKRDMTWQVVDPRLATVEELVQTPVLYLCGSQDPVPEGAAARREFAQKLRDYLDRGGFLFAEAYGEGRPFDEGFRRLMQEVFPEPEYKLRLLEPDHPIWYAEEKVAADQQRPIWGVEFGCRTSVVYVPPDPPAAPRPALSCLWELSRPGREQKYGRTVQSQIDAALSIGINVLAYATNRELQTKEDFFRPTGAAGPRDRVERGRLLVATLRHPGGCNAAPRAVVNLMESAAKELKIRTRVREELLGIDDNALFDYHLVFMHGRTAFRLTDTERQRLKQYIERGGMLMADSICASRAFSESFRREMATIFPDHPMERIPATDPIFSTTYGGADLKLVSRRDPSAGSGAGKPLETVTRKVPPDLDGVKFGDRWGVVFSRFDLSCALEKRDSLGCQGYTREDAARLGLNIVLYSLQQ